MLFGGCLMAALLVAASCGEGGIGAGNPIGTPPLNSSRPWDGSPAAYVRVDVAVAAGAARIRAAARVTAPPLPAAVAGTMLAVARTSDGRALDSAMLQFDTVARSAGYDGNGNFVEEDEETDSESGSATVFLLDDPALDRIDVLDASGNVASTVPATDIEPAQLSGLVEANRRALAGPRTLAATASDGLAEYGWILVLGPADMNRLPREIQKKTTSLVEPTAEQLSLFHDCLDTMTETSRKSVRTIAFGKFPDSKTPLAGDKCDVKLGRTYGGQIVINADINGPEVSSCVGPSSRRRFISTCVHEAAHAFTYLVENKQGTVKWEQDALTLAQQKIHDYGLSAGLEDLFETMQSLAVNQAASTHAVNYTGTTALNNAMAVSGGFASGYGAKSAWEDIAEYTAQMQAPDLPPGTEPELCRLFGQAGLLSEFTAIQYAKALLLRNIGLVDEDPFSRCTHNLGIDAPPGIVAPGSSFQFTSNLNFGYFDLDDSRMFGVVGDGADTYRALLRVKVENARPPLGLQRLDAISLLGVDSAQNGLLLANDNSFKARTSIGGLAVVSQITPHATSGLIFFLGLGSLGLFPTDIFPVVTFYATK